MIARASLWRVVAAVCAGAAIGVIVGLETPAHLEVAGSQAAVRVHLGRPYDQIALSSHVLVGTRATSRSVLGEPVGISVDVDLDPGSVVAANGSFNSNVVPAYVQAYSDPDQIVRDLRWALVKHMLGWTGTGVGVAGAAVLVAYAYREWRKRRLNRLSPSGRAATEALLADTATLRRRVAVGVVVVGVLAFIPSGRHSPPPPRSITPNPILAGTPFAGTQVSGLLSPALTAIRAYIEKYIAQTNDYYDQLRDKMLAAIDAQHLALPSGTDITHLIFVTDRHCNIGMDRVIVALAQRFGVNLLVSGGDDDFSGSFPFESACTKNLASKSQQAGMTDLFVSGNHDSAVTRTDEAAQHVVVLDGTPAQADGLTFVGLHDPRTSRYGQGIRPSSDSAQRRLLVAQGSAAGRIACGLPGPVIVVLHDPLAGQQAIHGGCGKITIALDGHTHHQIGPTPTGRAGDGTEAYTFVGASTGGAPGEGAVERTFASRLTVGPLNHDAAINIVSVDATSGALVGVTVVHFSPDQDVTFETLSTR